MDRLHAASRALKSLNEPRVSSRMGRLSIERPQARLPALQGQVDKMLDKATSREDRELLERDRRVLSELAPHDDIVGSLRERALSYEISRENRLMASLSMFLSTGLTAALGQTVMAAACGLAAVGLTLHLVMTSANAPEEETLAHLPVYDRLCRLREIYPQGACRVGESDRAVQLGAVRLPKRPPAERLKGS